MPCYVSFDLFYAVSPSSFLFPPLLFFRFLNVVPVLWFSVCTADQVTLFSFHFLILTPPPLLWLVHAWRVWFGGVPTPRIRHLWLVAGPFRDTPQPNALPHPPMPTWLKHASNSPRSSLVTTLSWRTPDLVCPRGSLRTTKVAKQGPSANSPVKDLKDLSAMDAFRSRSISVSEHAVRR